MQATAERDQHVVRVTEWDKFVPTLDGKNIVLAPWCDTTACEDAVKKKSGEESLKAKAEENLGFRLTGTFVHSIIFFSFLFTVVHFLTPRQVPLRPCASLSNNLNSLQTQNVSLAVQLPRSGLCLDVHTK